MLFEDLKTGIDAVLSPEKNTKGTLSLTGSIMMYYKFVIVPLVLIMVVGLATNLATYGTIVAIFAAISTVIIYALYPIGILVAAGIYHISGLVIGGFKKGYSNTFTATVYGVFPAVLVAWLTTLVTTLSVVAGFLVSFIVGIWSIYVLVVSLSNQQGVSKTQAFLAWLIPTIIVGVLVIVIIGAAALALVGMNNSTIPGAA